MDHHDHQLTNASRAFLAAIDRNWTNNALIFPGAAPGCIECDLDATATQEQIDVANEGGFSWRECDCCGSHLGGHRSPAHHLDGQQMIHLDVCVDCLHYLANGDVPDVWEP